MGGAVKEEEEHDFEFANAVSRDRYKKICIILTGAAFVEIGCAVPLT